ncbi:inorganic phosphate transporter [Pseudomaricurvus sp. HS19]|uniref:inorganic phosphate transporter n=1 Tax=Pseudomaricurvus sp. HS19 TaxID=2692626 RepID=UPI001369C830|nr:inorganic phosphate transporter [Pseudomaricurvus sp. HS19]MYM62153.1 inorganic phosphate transporter [Pseudomaricurvus sp. HS19]
MTVAVALLVVTILLVLLFDLTNGFHDAANMIATLIASQALTPGPALLLVGVFTFIGPLLAGTLVADTIGGFVSLEGVPATLGISLVLCAVLAAVGWNLLTWLLAMPSSSSHALVGGLVGAVSVTVGPAKVLWGLSDLEQGQLVGVTKVLLSLLLSPLLGFAAGYLLHRLSCFLLRAAHPSINQRLRQLQWLTAAVLAFAHGTNDAQKGMGIITLVLLLGGFLQTFEVPVWVIFASAGSITLGTMLGGWRIVKTVGYGIYRLRPLHGLNAQLSSSLVILAASLAGGPVSTTHVVSSSIMGLGAAERPRAVHWVKAREIALTWLFTLPGSALLGALLAWPVFYLLQGG